MKPCSRRRVRLWTNTDKAAGRSLLYSMLYAIRRLTPSTPWWPWKRRRRAASVDGVQGRAGAATSAQSGSPSSCLETATERPGAAILSPGKPVNPPVVNAVRSGEESGELASIAAGEQLDLASATS
jgi:hypothetical protein